MYQVFEPPRIINSPTAKSVHLLLNGLKQLARALPALADYGGIFDYMLVYSGIKAFDRDNIEYWESSHTNGKEILSSRN